MSLGKNVVAGVDDWVRFVPVSVLASIPVVVEVDLSAGG